MAVIEYQYPVLTLYFKPK